MMTERNIPSRKWLEDMARAEDEHESISVGGLASELDLLQPVRPEPPRILGLLMELARRARGWTLETLAERSDVLLEELVAIERNELSEPSPRTLYQLGKTLAFSTGKLMELAGQATPRDPRLAEAALRFAARSEPTAQLSPDEREAYEEFVKVLAENSDQDG